MSETTGEVVLSIPEALTRLQKAKVHRDEARDAADQAQDDMIDAAKVARRSGVPVARIADEVDLSRQQTHRLLGDTEKVDGA